MNIGFTGTRKGMNSRQIHNLRSWLISHVDEIESFHHGCCVGADTQAHIEAYSLGLNIHFHPPIIQDYASDLRDFNGVWNTPKGYLERNRDIVYQSDILIAGPDGSKESLRSGTWYTVRYARKVGKEVIILNREKILNGE